MKSIRAMPCRVLGVLSIAIIMICCCHGQEDPATVAAVVAGCENWACENGGNCRINDESGNPECQCPPGMSGTRCEMDEEASEAPLDCDLVCRNGGECEIGMGENTTTPICLCPSGTSGNLCETLEDSSNTGSENEGAGAGAGEGSATGPSDPTEQSLACNLICEQNGVCEIGLDGTASPTCICPPGWTGELCETQEMSAIDASAVPTAAPTGCNIQCENGGECILGESSDYECICPPGMSGTLCEGDEMAMDEAGCDLKCDNGGECEIGIGNTPEPKCICPPGTSGDLCEINDADNSASGSGGGDDDPAGITESAEGTPCGVDACYHGSPCVQGGNGGLYCDCTSIDEPGKHYAGRFCQYEATNYCSDKKGYFCLNGGECRSEGNGVFSCECSEEWTGPSCEFESQTRDHVFEKCTMSCWNGGQCRKGAMDMSALGGLDESLEHLAVDEAHSENDEHCVCPKGYTGSRCEHKYDECGNGEHLCLHGSKCVPPKDPLHPYWTCECDDSSGQFCNHHRNSMCTASDTAFGVYQGMLSLAYCVNDGVCMEFVRDGKRVPGCKCPTMYTGPHCELLRTDFRLNGAPTDKETTTQSAAGLFVLFALCILMVALALFIYTRIRGQTGRDKTSIIQAAHIEDEASKTPMMEEVDFEGALEDVELL